jgi:hypothetical protein
MTEPPRGTAVAAGSRQEAAAPTAVTTAATAASTVPPAPAPAAGDQVAVVEIPDNDAPRQPPSLRRGASDAGGQLCDVAASDAWRRCLVVTRR